MDIYSALLIVRYLLLWRLQVWIYVFGLLPTHNRAVWPVFLHRDYWPCVDFFQMCIHKIRVRVYLKFSIKRNPIKVSFKFECMFTNWNDKSKETVDT